MGHAIKVHLEIGVSTVLACPAGAMGHACSTSEKATQCVLKTKAPFMYMLRRRSSKFSMCAAGLQRAEYWGALS